MSTSNKSASIAGQHPVTTYYSVRRQVALALAIPLVLLAIEGGLGWWGFSWIAASERRAVALAKRFDECSNEYSRAREAYNATLPDLKKLTASSAAVTARANAIAQSFGMIPETVSERIVASDVVLLRPMQTRPAGVRLRLRGSPERLHQFFAQLEAEHPGLSVMAAKVETAEGQIMYDTTYLIPDYGTLKAE